jgi:hypothetical protein
MVRLKSIKKVRVVDPESDSEGPGLEVTFEGPAGESARCEITLTMKDHGTDMDVYAQRKFFCAQPSGSSILASADSPKSPVRNSLIPLL